MAKDEKTRIRQRKWYEEHRQETIDRAVKRQTDNHDEYLKYQKANRELHIEEYRAKARRWKAEHIEQHRASSRRYGREHKEEISKKLKAKRRALKQAILDAYGGVCACCGEATYEFLTLDHMDGNGSSHRSSLGIGVGRTNKLYQHLIDTGFPSGYRILCFNCNSSRGFYGYCPHHPEDTNGIPPSLLVARLQAS